MNLPRNILIDKEDRASVSKHTWWIKPNGYVYTQINRKSIYLHRFVMSALKGTYVDHINRNKLDNRKVNLRFCTQSQNNMNKNGIRGVSKYKDGWRARIKINRREIHIGIFSSFAKAVKMRRIFERNLFGEFSNI